MPSGGENTLFLWMVIAFSGVIVGAVFMYMMMKATQNRKTAKDPEHTKPLHRPEETAEIAGTEVMLEEVEAAETLAAESMPEPILESGPVITLPAIITETEAEDAPYPDLENEFSVWRTGEEKQLLVKMEESWHENGENLDVDQRGRLLAALQDAASWLGLKVMAETAAVVKEPEKGEPKKVEPAAAPAQAAVVKNAAAPVLKTEVPMRNMSIVEQVDAYLQDILAEEGLTGENIRLTEMSNRGLIVWVGKEHYDGLDAITDPKVKQLIRRAVDRWEETYTGT